MVFLLVLSGSFIAAGANAHDCKLLILIKEGFIDVHTEWQSDAVC